MKYSTYLEAAEEVIVLVGGEVVLGLVPVTARPRHVVAGPGHVLQQRGLPGGDHYHHHYYNHHHHHHLVWEDVPALETRVEVHTPPDVVDHLHLEQGCCVSVPF